MSVSRLSETRPSNTRPLSKENIISTKLFLCHCSLGNLNAIKLSLPENEYLLNMGIVNAIAHNKRDVANYLYPKLSETRLCINNIMFRFHVAGVEIEPETYRWVFHRLRTFKSINKFSLDCLRNNPVALMIYFDTRLGHHIKSQRLQSQ